MKSGVNICINNLKPLPPFMGILIFIVLLFFSCEKKAEDPIIDWDNHQAFKAQYSISSLNKTTIFSNTGEVVNKVDLREVSGLAESQVNNSTLWAHNDSGNGNILYLLDKATGRIKVQYQLKGIENIDWEDIEVGPGPIQGVSYIYLGDIGDNSGDRENAIIYRFKEPVFDGSQEGKLIELNIDHDALVFTYPGGSRDAETLLLDHNSNDLYIISKRDLPARIYVFPFPQDAKKKTKVILVGTIPLFAPVGGNVNPNGKEILVKTYDKIFYWQHEKEEPLWKSLSRAPEVAPYNPIEPQGEAICFDTSGNYFTLSEEVERKEVFLYNYKRIK